MVVFGKTIFKNWDGGYAWYWKLLLFLVINSAIMTTQTTITDSLGLTDYRAYDEWKDSERWKDNFTKEQLAKKMIFKDSYCYKCPSSHNTASGIGGVLTLILGLQLVGFINKRKILKLEKEKIIKDPLRVNKD